MVQSLIKKKAIKVIYLTPHDKFFYYLRPEVKIICRIDERFDFEFELDFELELKVGSPQL